MPDVVGWAVALAGSPWMLLIVYSFITIDGVFPPVPSESVVIVLAALATADGGPDLWLLGSVAAAGAFTGDQVAYSIGRRITVRHMRTMRSPRAQQAVLRAETALARRGAALIIGARFIPVGRVAVNMTAGTVRFSRRRFGLLATIAAIVWSAYSILLGAGAGHLLAEHHPLAGVVVGVMGGLLIGVLVDRVLQRVLHRHVRQRAC